jgi:hypothetical protein
VGGGATVVDVAFGGSVVVAGAAVVVVVGAAAVLVVVGAVVGVVPLKVEVVVENPVLVGLDVVLVGADPDWTSSPPQPARTMKTTDVTPRTPDGDRRRVLKNPRLGCAPEDAMAALLRLPPARATPAPGPGRAGSF